MKWHYRVKPPAEKVRDPIQGEFFSTEAIKNPADALIRESIQNAMDARLRDGSNAPIESLRIRIFLATGKHSLKPSLIGPWFSGIWDHLKARGNGLREAPKVTSECPILVFEDFTTTGLQGDLDQSDPRDGNRNPFFYFFRAEGRSGKSDDDLGRWGVGKYVFPRSSQANTFFGLSVRADDKKRILMGHSVFKSHLVGDEYYSPDGYWGSVDSRGFVSPVLDSKTIEEFSTTFRIARRETESGLSVVVPWLDPEITFETLVDAVVRGYFHPILTGMLVVTIETPDESLVIDDSSLDEAALRMSDHQEGMDLLNIVELATWASTRKPKEIIKLAACRPDRPQWSDDLVPADQLDDLRAALDKGSKLAFRGTVTVRKKGSDPEASNIDLYLWKDGFESGRPTFIREGLIISDVKAPRTRGIRSLVIAEKGALAALLGDAENPAHTEWQSKGENFHGKYTYGPAFLTFVINFSANVVRTLSAEEGKEDKNLLIDIFSIPDNSSDNNQTIPTPKKKPERGKVEEPEVHSEPSKKRFRLLKTKGGFTLTRGDAGTAPPARLTVEVAYDIRRGNPLRKYSKSDFELTKKPLVLSPPEGAQILMMEENRILAEIADPNFKISMSGFDEMRDLFIKVRMEEGEP